MGIGDNSPSEPFFCDEGVKKGLDSPTRHRFDAILNEHGWKWSDIYSDIQLSKCYASQIRNGHLIPPEWLRVKIATKLQVDTSVLWKVPELITADKLEDSKNG